MGYGRQYAFHTAVTVATTVLTGALFYVLRIAFYQYLTPEQYGLFYAAYSFAMAIQPVLSFGFDPGLVPYITQFREEKKPEAIRDLALTALVPQCVFALALGLAVAMLAGPASRALFSDTAGAGLLVILAVHAFLAVLFKSGQQILLAVQSLVWRNVADLVRAVACLAFGYLFVSRGLGVNGVGWAYTAAAAAAVLLQTLAIAVSHRSILRGRPQWSWHLTSRAFGSGKYLSLAFGGIVVFSSLDTMFITVVRGDMREVAAYQIALPTAMIIYSLITAAGLSFMPMARTLWVRNERALLADGLGRIYEAACVLILPAGVLMAAFSDVLITTLFGSDILNAPEAFNLLAVAGVFYFVSYLNLHVLAGIGQAKAAASIIGVALAVDLLLDPVLIYFFGIQGAAGASLIGYCIASLLGMYAVAWKLPIRWPVKALFTSAAGSAVLWCACSWVKDTALFGEWPRLTALGTAFSLFFALVLVLELIGAARMRHLIAMMLPGRRGNGS
ncbi:MAG: polysaccharide biosynthesis C-terminal domain-containing protein [Candidatus Hydrogenedentes bacterium]|nr:polysaccharide biosynthesis C-terminal domain-containing protein [Candidatus Hydrogenedentota bacterium]